MNQSLINKYFKDQCSEEELEQVLNWFQTDEGQSFLEEDMDQQRKNFDDENEVFLYPEIPAEMIFSRIQRNKKNSPSRDRRFYNRIAAVLILAVGLSSLLYWGGIITPQKNTPKHVLLTYVTAPGQQKIITLSEGTKIRLNEGSRLTVPQKFRRKKRVITLKGEAFFDVIHDEERPFVVKAHGVMIRDVGTQFNVRASSGSGMVQVAVIQGKVALGMEDRDPKTRAILSRNHFGTLRLSDRQITIEKGNVENYMSWINRRLIFNGESLDRVSRQLERLYDVPIRFETPPLKGLHLSANFEKTNLKDVLTIIANTLDIHFKMSQNHVIWTE